MKQAYTFSEIIDSLPLEKRSSDSYWTRYVLRPLSYPLTWILLRTGLTPNAVSFLSVGIALLGGLGLAFDGSLGWVGVGLLFLFSILDCVDGNMARTTRSRSSWGAWSDALGGYVAYTAALLGVGASTQPILGGLAAASNLLMRVVVQSRRVSELSRNGAVSSKREQDSPGFEKKLSENLGVTGILVPALSIGLATDTTIFVLLFYTVLYVGGAGVIIFKLMLKTLTEDRKGRATQDEETLKGRVDR